MGSERDDARQRTQDELKRADSALHEALAAIKEAQRLSEKYGFGGAAELAQRARQIESAAQVIEERHAAASGGCFPGDVEVRTPTGWQRIDAIKPGDLVLSHVGRLGDSRTVPRRVLRLLRHPPERIWHLDLGRSGAPVRTTRRHAFLTARGWTRADHLRPGDQLIDLCSSTGASRVVSADPSPDSVPVFNLHTAGNHTFIVSGLVAHNFSRLLILRGWLYAATLDPVLRLVALLSRTRPGQGMRSPSRGPATRRLSMSRFVIGLILYATCIGLTACGGSGGSGTSTFVPPPPTPPQPGKWDEMPWDQGRWQ